MTWSRKHVITIESMSREEICSVLDVAGFYRRECMKAGRAPQYDTLKGFTAVNMFFENSTRTRISFELAEKRLGMTSIDFNAPASSLSKGESFEDTLMTINAMNVDAIVIRHPMNGSAQRATEYVDGSVISGGDGTYAHPTQALLDALSLRERVGSLEGLRVAIIGDILHSRVASSQACVLRKLGARVFLAGPSAFLPDSFKDDWKVEGVFHDLDETLPGMDVLSLLRVQKERMCEAEIPSFEEYHRLWGITRERLARAGANALVMHPGPINRGVELSGDVADSERSLILEQVACGVAVRMALLQLLLGESAPR